MRKEGATKKTAVLGIKIESLPWVFLSAPFLALVSDVRFSVKPYFIYENTSGADVLTVASKSYTKVTFDKRERRYKHS